MSNEMILSQVERIAANFDMQGTNTGELADTLIRTVFKNAKPDEFLALLIVANQYKLNPFTKEIYAFPAKGGGITPVVGIDGWARIINDNPVCDGIQFEQDDESCTCKIYRKDRTHPTVVTEYLSECLGTSEPWKKYPKRMLRHKALIQCARVAFGFSGIYDEDEAKRIDDCHATTSIKNVTPEIPEGYAEFEAENLPKFNSASQYGTEQLLDMHATLDRKNAVHKLFWATHSPNFKQIAQIADKNLAERTHEHSPA